MNRVCLLTGASGALGTAFCRQNAIRYDIAAVYRRKPPDVSSQQQRFFDPLDPLRIVPENQNQIFAVQADLSDDDELDRVVDLVLARFGRIDLLVNAAVYSVWAPMVDSRHLVESVETQLYFNVILPLKLSTIVARKFWRNRDTNNLEANRNVVNVSSIAGIKIYEGIGQSVYSASKAALNHLTHHMAHEFWDFRVRVNATAPDSFPHNVSTERVVQSIVDLDEGSVTGKIMVVDGKGERAVDAP